MEIIKTPLKKDELYIQRCLDIAKLGAGSVSPNPLVGAVLVHDEEIIGEGYHKVYGSAHAEVNTLESVPPSKRHLIPESTLYVSLEPCSITGHTPPCTSLIINNKIKAVVTSATDYTPGVYQQSKRILLANNIPVTDKILYREGNQLCAYREKYIRTKLPYIILKYAQTKDGFIGKKNNQQYWISNAYSRRLVHKWRSEVDAILVGTNTALIDNPSLTTRYYFGKSPIRILIDKDLRVPNHYELFNEEVKTIVFNQVKNEVQGNIEWIQLDFTKDILPQLLTILHDRAIATLLVEGGAQTLQTFIKGGLWDEARVITADKLLGDGIPAPQLDVPTRQTVVLDTDVVGVYFRE